MRRMARPTDQTRPRYRVPRGARIKRGGDFTRALRSGVRLVDEQLTVWGCRNGLGITRLGLTVGKRHGGAVQRNRLKRVLREAFRLERPNLPAGLDLILAPRPGVRLVLRNVRAALVSLAQRLARRLLSV